MDEQTQITPPLGLREMEWFGKQVPGGFFIYHAGAEMDLVYVNRATLRIFGCETEEQFRSLTGWTFPGMIHPADRERGLRSIDTQIAAGRNENVDYVEYRILRADGEERWVDDYGHCAELDGRDGVFYVFLWDITERRRERERQFRVEMDLEREKHANEIKSSFLFNISHDIRTPMNAIVGFSELARRHINEPERLTDYLDKVAQSSRELLSLIDDVLEMSKIEYGRIELKAEPCSLREQLEMVTDLFRAQIEEKNLALEEHVELPEDNVLADAHRFRRVMSNLMSNAVKFTPAGGKIGLSARQKQASDSGYVRYEFSVSDTGVGMSEEFMKRMYEAFEREQSSTRAGTIGTGLGLSITKNLLNIMGGSITVRSKKGEGTVFTVDLPLKLANYLSPATSSETVTEDFRAKGEHRILLVEDIEINRMLAETILEDAGFLVESVPDGCDAVDAISSHPLWYYDLVLMDIQMPVMNGYEATRAIRALGRQDTASLPIIALSANARDEDKIESFQSGMNNHIAKPFDVAHLISTVNEHIAKREDGESASAKS